MISENYIHQYFNLQKSTAKENRLHLQVRISLYNQYYNAILPSVTGQQKNHVTKKLCSMYFFILFNCLVQNVNALSRTCNLSMSLLCKAISCHNHDQFIKYRDILQSLLLIDYNSYYSPDRKTNKEITSYTVNISPKGIDCSLNRFIELEYPVSYKTVKYFNKQLKYINNLSSFHCNNIYGTSSAVTINPPTTYTQRCTFDFQSFLNRYSRLKYDGVPAAGEDFKYALKLIQEHLPAKIANDGRIYHSFHEIKHVHRQNILFDNEHIVEVFDVHNCHFCLLWAALDNTVSEMERDNFYNLVTSGKFYESVMDYFNKNNGEQWSREFTKQQCVAYLNTKNSVIARGRNDIDRREHPNKYRAAGYYRAWVDKYFEEFYPGVRQFIKNVKSKSKSAMHYILAPIETKIITLGVIKELYEKYGIEALSLHDGIFVKESDAKYMKDNNISTERMFKEFINLSNLI